MSSFSPASGSEDSRLQLLLSEDDECLSDEMGDDNFEVVSAITEKAKMRHLSLQNQSSANSEVIPCNENFGTAPYAGILTRLQAAVLIDQDSTAWQRLGSTADKLYLWSGNSQKFETARGLLSKHQTKQWTAFYKAFDSESQDETNSLNLLVVTSPNNESNEEVYSKRRIAAGTIIGAFTGTLLKWSKHDTDYDDILAELCHQKRISTSTDCSVTISVHELMKAAFIYPVCSSDASSNDANSSCDLLLSTFGRDNCLSRITRNDTTPKEQCANCGVAFLRMAGKPTLPVCYALQDVSAGEQLVLANDCRISLSANEERFLASYSEGKTRLSSHFLRSAFQDQGEGNSEENWFLFAETSESVGRLVAAVLSVCSAEIRVQPQGKGFSLRIAAEAFRRMQRLELMNDCLVDAALLFKNGPVESDQMSSADAYESSAKQTSHSSQESCANRQSSAEMSTSKQHFLHGVHIMLAEAVQKGETASLEFVWQLLATESDAEKIFILRKAEYSLFIDAIAAAQSPSIVAWFAIKSFQLSPLITEELAICRNYLPFKLAPKTESEKAMATIIFEMAKAADAVARSVAHSRWLELLASESEPDGYVAIIIKPEPESDYPHHERQNCASIVSIQSSKTSSQDDENLTPLPPALSAELPNNASYATACLSSIKHSTPAAESTSNAAAGQQLPQRNQTHQLPAENKSRRRYRNYRRREGGETDFLKAACIPESFLPPAMQMEHPVTYDKLDKEFGDLYFNADSYPMEPAPRRPGAGWSTKSKRLCHDGRPVETLRGWLKLQLVKGDSFPPIFEIFQTAEERDTCLQQNRAVKNRRPRKEYSPTAIVPYSTWRDRQLVYVDNSKDSGQFVPFANKEERNRAHKAGDWPIGSGRTVRTYGSTRVRESRMRARNSQDEAAANAIVAGSAAAAGAINLTIRTNDQSASAAMAQTIQELATSNNCVAKHTDNPQPNPTVQPLPALAKTSAGPAKKEARIVSGLVAMTTEQSEHVSNATKPPPQESSAQSKHKRNTVAKPKSSLANRSMSELISACAALPRPATPVSPLPPLPHHPYPNLFLPNPTDAKLDFPELMPSMPTARQPMPDFSYNHAGISFGPTRHEGSRNRQSPQQFTFGLRSAVLPIQRAIPQTQAAAMHLPMSSQSTFLPNRDVSIKEYMALPVERQSLMSNQSQLVAAATDYRTSLGGVSVIVGNTKPLEKKTGKRISAICPTLLERAEKRQRIAS